MGDTEIYTLVTRAWVTTRTRVDRRTSNAVAKKVLDHVYREDPRFSIYIRIADHIERPS